MKARTSTFTLKGPIKDFRLLLNTMGALQKYKQA